MPVELVEEAASVEPTGGATESGKEGETASKESVEESIEEEAEPVVKTLETADVEEELQPSKIAEEAAQLEVEPKKLGSEEGVLLESAEDETAPVAESPQPILTEVDDVFETVEATSAPLVCAEEEQVLQMQDETAPTEEPTMLSSDLAEEAVVVADISVENKEFMAPTDLQDKEVTTTDVEPEEDTDEKGATGALAAAGLVVAAGGVATFGALANVSEGAPFEATAIQPAEVLSEDTHEVASADIENQGEEATPELEEDMLNIEQDSVAAILDEAVAAVVAGAVTEETATGEPTDELMHDDLDLKMAAFGAGATSLEAEAPAPAEATSLEAEAPAPAEAVAEQEEGEEEIMLVAVASAACGNNRNIVNFSSSGSGSPKRSSAKSPPTIVEPTVEESQSSKPRSYAQFVIADDGSLVTMNAIPENEELDIESGADAAAEIDALMQSNKQQPGGADHYPHIASHEKAAVKYEENAATPWYGKRRFMIIAGVVVLIAIIVGISVPLATRGGDGAKTQEDYAVDVMMQVSDEAALNDSSSPQYAAMNWILNGDTLSTLDVPPTAAQEKALLQRYILAVFYFSTQGDDWSSRSNWLDKEQPECGEGGESPWQYIGCQGGEVTSIFASEAGIGGIIPSELNGLTALSTLALFSNSVTGIADGFAPRAMIGLDLGENELIGTIPSSFYGMSLLQQLYLERNNLVGTISPQIGNFRLLRELTLIANSLTGTLTTEFQSLRFLELLSLNRNDLAGNFETIIRGMTSLTFLSIRDTSVTGTIPTDISDYNLLTALDLGKTSMEGTIPTTIGLMNQLGKSRG